MPNPILTHHQKQVPANSKVVYPQVEKNKKVQTELEKQKSEAEARMKASIKESVEKNGFLLSGIGGQGESPIPKKDLNMIDIERAVMVGQLIQEDKHLVEKNLWLDEKSLLKSRIVELEAFCYSETQEKQKLYSENLGLNAENFTLSTTADELCEALEKNRYLEETLQKRNDFIKTLQDEQYQLGNTIETLNLKLDKKDEYLKHIDSQRMDAINRAFNSSESFARSSEKVIAQQQIIKNLQDEKFEVEVDLEEVKESYDNLNKKYEDLKISFTELQKCSNHQSDLINDLDRKFRFEKNNYEGASRLYHASNKENEELREEIKKLGSVLDVKNSSLNVRNAYIEVLEKRLMDYVFKNDNVLLNLFNASKSTGTLYFVIWLVIWIFCLFTFLKFIG